MKLKSKIIISFCIIIFVPIVLMMAALFSFQRIQVKAIEQTYGIKENNYSYFSNSMQLLSRFTKECFKELKDAAKNDPARLEDQEYLNELNQTLEEKSSYLIVRKDKELIYIGEDASISLLTQLPSYGDTVKDEDASRLKRYSVVVGSFKNKTNAYALKERMQNDGYNAVLGENEQGMLRVIVASFDNKADAADSRDAIKAKYAPNFQDAWLLERAY